ncbi:Phospholipase D1-like protein [Emericellopsis cladophorae]|uniref:phospholipase D n=1 Tax=Emericellopsis cladophorae TaxID=2686198 RepID=A0A9P9Y7X6_9HYPO|nr:Phospholipase D1-like protein [Emericellopsis cladophorae]KAI6785101.1 Phospholipase D1-like protein [Emericellopsis cladophorae]
MASFFKKVQGDIEAMFGDEKHSHAHLGHACDDLHSEEHRANRYHSFAPESSGDAKWYVDGCSYFWAVSEALEQAKEEIFILDWWLSPELYLRRPPSQNEQYRVDNMLKAAAERGVKVHIIVYKEVEAALTCNSNHTRKALEALHPNIGVFRHPDHTPTGYDLASEFGGVLDHLTNFDLAKASSSAVEAIYGTADGMVLFWAHHEKLIVVDRKLGFMGGLDMCFGRWDTSSHPIADAHPGNLDAIVFPGQDYNNARVYDFHDSSRMGWSDVAMSMQGPIVDSMILHFVDRWNYIWDEKYKNKDGAKYTRLQADGLSTSGEQTTDDGANVLEDLTNRFSRGMNKFMHFGGQDGNDDAPRDDETERTKMQLTRSATKWSSGHPTEHSVANAYVDAISNAKHYVYIENQAINKLGAVMVDRILRAHRAGEAFKIWVVMPAVPAFAGDLHSDGALGTRAIMEFQYFSISRGGHSILETLRNEGVEDPGQYIGFYNLRNYDRINISQTMDDAEREAGVSYEEARMGHDEQVGDGSSGEGRDRENHYDQYRQYQKGAAHVADHTRDTVSSCYMDGARLSDVGWDGPDPETEMDAYVSEELYVHSKLLIADDRLVICGSANLNDRSQLGTHDSEIAVVIEDPTPVESRMNGAPYTASQFAASLRRYIFRKHLGLLPDQRWDEPNQNWRPVNRAPNDYDWGSPSDYLVQDPMHPDFHQLWDGTARVNTETFSKAFHPVPNDHVRTWKDYKNFFSRHFIIPGVDKAGSGDEEGGKVEYGHVIREEFPGGVVELKAWLSRIRGTLVQMPLDFLVDVDDIAKEGLELNSLTQVIYT